ncbi:MAG: hypothetical protein GX053_04735, partial [Tissierella sp.]|nr:hypothetical protein [Tissierella sp.]
SLHYVVQLNETRENLEEYLNYKNMKFEIQIRSVLQDTWAEIEHQLSYKSGIIMPQDIKRTFSRLSSLLETADISFRNLRDEITNYIENAEAEMDKENNIELNDITLSVLLNSDFYNNYIDLFKNKLNEQINKDIDIIEYNIQISEAKRLKYNSINTIEELKKYLNDFLDKIVDFTKFNYEDDINEKIKISRTFPLFALNYGILINNTEEEDLYSSFCEYFKYANIIWSDDENNYEHDWGFEDKDYRTSEKNSERLQWIESLKDIFK